VVEACQFHTLLTALALRAEVDMNAIHKERLLKLAAFLRTVPPEKFDLSSFISDIHYDEQGPACGTTACAIGWCPVVFPNDCRVELGDEWPSIRFTGESYDWTDWEDDFDAPGQKFFGVNDSEWDHLFEPLDDETDEHVLRTPAEEADVIEAFVASKEESCT
jgi:hypothetical protein